MSDMTYQQMCEVAEAVPESEEPLLCSCGRHYVGVDCVDADCPVIPGGGRELRDKPEAWTGRNEMRTYTVTLKALGDTHTVRITARGMVEAIAKAQSAWGMAVKAVHEDDA